MKKIVAISGSLRNSSYNTMLLKELGKLINNENNYEILDISNIPLFNEDLENEGYPEKIENLKSKISEADLIVIATPEYNYSVSGVLKNALDWFSRGNNPVFWDKRVAIMSASLSRFGGVRAQGHLRQILLCMGADVINSELFIASADQLFTENNLTDERTIKSLKKFANTIIEEIN